MKQAVIRFVNVMLGIMVATLLAINQTAISQTKTMAEGPRERQAEDKFSPNGKLTGDALNDAISLTIQQGSPNIYGEELAISFNRVQEAINVLQRFDPGFGDQKIVLNDEEKKRYTKIGLSISCEYCCGAKAIVFPNGEAACGCAHSQAMRALAAYLVQKHGSEFSDDEILRELAMWKGLFFPKQMIQKMATALQSGSFTPDVAALALGINLPSYGGKVKNAPLPSEFKNLPGMVGGC
ncbi:MAG: hypothetical protein HY564_02130 [Candidatus Jacksonbacteria bacterium]|nr:hypothetical protein [Candidatus Jacksonbacteria bacterium]